MKLSTIAMVLALLFSFSANAKTAPDFNLENRAGEPVKLSDYRGKVVLLDFWASWCIPCRASFPWMNAMQRKYQARGLQVVTVNLDKETEEKERFLNKYHAGFVVLSDKQGLTPSTYNVLGMPTSLVIDREGNIVFRHIGYQASKAEEYEAIIKKALGLGAH